MSPRATQAASVQVAGSPRGLTSLEAKDALLQFGPNVFSGAPQPSLLARAGKQIMSPLALVLLLAGIGTIFLGAHVDSIVIFLALAINVAISMYQEGRADRAFVRLKASQGKYAVVIRDGARHHIPSEEVVPGDVVVLEAGMHVPADIRLVEAKNLEVNEAPLTGEWIEVAKSAESKGETDEKHTMAYMGTLAVSGIAKGIVVATGDRTEIGKIAKTLATTVEIKTPLELNVARIARFLSIAVFVALCIIFLAGLYRGQPLGELVLVSIAIAVAAIPEGLPAAVTVILAIGTEALLSRKGLVRNLLAAETLGGTTVILTDKTGTLTTGEMRVAKVVTLGGLAAGDAARSALKVHETHGDERDVLEFAALASDAFIETKGADTADALREKSIHGRPVERAVVLAALESGIDQRELLARYPRIDFLPFASAYRAAFSLNHIRGISNNRLYVTGAPEYVLHFAGAFYSEGRTHMKTRALHDRFSEVLDTYTRQGMRLIGVAYRDVAMNEFPAEGEGKLRSSLLEGLVFAGFIVLEDPLRSDAKLSIETAQNAGARVIMVTGDNKETAKTIASACGIWREGDAIETGDFVEHASDEELVRACRRTSVFARMLPLQKLRLAEILGREGEIVAMTGDGVNDAPALRQASIGVALGSGTEVAKEASDLILIDNSFSIIVAAIEEGRRIVDNLRKVIAYLLSTSFTEIIVVGGALVGGLPIPLLPTQILWTNMLSEGLMNFAFAFEPKEDDLMRRDPRSAGARNMFSGKLRSFIIFVGFFSGIILLGFYIAGITWFGFSPEEARTLTFIALTVTTLLIAFSLKDLRAPLHRVKFLSNPYLLGSLGAAIAGLLIALYVVPVRDMLHLVPMDPVKEWPLVLIVTVISLFGVEMAKRFFFSGSRAVAK